MPRTGKEILESVIGSSALNRFDRMHNFSCIISNKQYTFVHDGNNLTVHDTHMQIGNVSLDDRDVYDIIYAIIEGINTGKINFGCGKLEIKLPKNMPSKTLSFGSYIMYRRPKWSLTATSTTVSIFTFPAILTSILTKINPNGKYSLWNEEKMILSGFLFLIKNIILTSWLCAHGYLLTLPIVNPENLGPISVVCGIIYGLVISIIDLITGYIIYDYKKWKAYGGILE